MSGASRTERRDPGVPAVRSDLRRRASVVVDFGLADLVRPDDDVEDVLDFLDEDCQRVQTPAGQDRWTLTDHRRTQALTSAPAPELTALRAAAVGVRRSVLQDALDRSLGVGWAFGDVTDLSAEEAKALTVVAGWWAGRRPRVPRPEDLLRLNTRLALFADVRAMADDRFVGRHAALAELHQHLLSDQPRPFVLHGPGGIGKSALLARHIVRALDEASATVALLDFDDPTLNPAYPADLVARLIDLVARQVGGLGRSAVDRLGTVAADVAGTSSYRAQTQSRSSTLDAQAWGPLIDDLVGLVPGTILVALDTFEEVQRRGPSAVYAVLTIVGALLGHPDRIRVVVSGRAPVPELEPSPGLHLEGLERTEALALLSAVAGRAVDPRAAEAVVDRLGTSPLTIRLAAQVLARHDAELGDLVALAVHAERIDAELYRRFLAHIDDPEVRKIAHPGLVLRRVTADVIRHVLASACGVAVTGDEEAQALFERLAREAMLVERSPDGTALVHRADLRATMLPQLLRDRPHEARRIQEAAVRYYAARTDLPSKVEELYHRLMLGEPAAMLAERWDARAAEQLVPAMGELPPAARVHLATAQPDVYLSPADRRLVDDAQWAAQVEPQVLGLLASHSPQRALTLLAERRDSAGRSLLPALEIEAMELLGRLADAAAVARDHRRAAADVGDIDGVVTFTLHLARLLERLGRSQDAAQVLGEALASIGDPSVDRLRVLVAALGAARRSGERADDDAIPGWRREVASLARELPPRAIRGVPGLLRDLAAEVGDEQPGILLDALTTLGLDAYASGGVPEALRVLDEVVSVGAVAPEGVVAQIARLDPRGGEIPWRQIVNKPRGETGAVMAELLKTFGDQAHQLLTAVATDYQQEADAALLGGDLSTEAKR